MTIEMKKVFIYSICGALLLSGCGTYAGAGAYTGAQFGSILGSAIGGITDGYRGSHVGTIIGMAGGAVVGAMVGSAADEASRREVHDHYSEVQRRRSQSDASRYDDSGYYSPDNSGDDRLYDFQSSDYTGNYSAQPGTTVKPMSSSVDKLAHGLKYMPTIEIRNARVVDQDQNRVISRGEVCKVIFEIYNHGNKPLFDLQPTVVEATGNKQIYISPNMHVERVDPGQGIRYTAMLKAGSRLKNGMARICVSVLQGNKAISEVCEFNVPTRK